MAHGRITAFLLAAALFSVPVCAKNLDGRLGFGLSYLDFTGSTAVSAKYFHNSLVATKFLVGFNTESNTYQFGLQTSRMVLTEENMNVFLALGGSIVSSPDSTGVTGTGLQFEALIGGEFFIGGLPNLGIYFESGIALRSLRGTHFRSVGGGFAGGGIHYYF